MSRFSSKVVMIQPAEFGFNEETGTDNAFMNNSDASAYLDQFLNYKQILIDNGISVEHWVHPDPRAKDCIFANNWFTTLAQPDVRVPTLILCPMRHPTRRLERNYEFVEKLRSRYANVINLTHYEESGLSLEGTGSLVIDRLNHQIFMSLSERSSSQVLEHFIQEINKISDHIWRSVTFSSVDELAKPVYHTNVILSLTPKKAVLNIESIKAEDKERVIEALQGYEIVNIGYSETRRFAGNIECLYSADRGCEIAFISKRSEGLLALDCETVYVDISVIEEIGGGSTQCMLAKLF